MKNSPLEKNSHSILLDSNEIKQSLPDDIELTILQSIDSTNNFFKTQPQTNTIKCCLAEQQTQGRGRLDHTWHSPFGKNIYLSCYYPLQKNIRELGGFSLIIGLSILAALRTLGLTHNIHTKWPNDILCRNKKIAGILIEVQTESPDINNMTIGIGLNVNMLPSDEDTSESIEQAWTSLHEETGSAWDRNHVAAILLHHILSYIRRFEQEGFKSFINEWMTADSLMHKIITLNNMNNLITGEVVGINSQGHLLLRLPDNNIQAFSSGDVSVMKK